MNRGKKKNRIGKLKWSSRKANRGRKPAHGKRKGMITWKEVRSKVMREGTVVVVPSKEEREKAKAERKAAEA
jgi:hypothetical protein